MAARLLWRRLQNYQSVKFAGRCTLFTIIFLSWLPVVISVNDHIVQLVTIEGPSMYPYFNAEKDRTTRSDLVVNWKLNAQTSLQRGMIVTFWNPMDPETKVVKRIVGVEGDLVRTRAPYPSPTIRVPAGHIWVEGDGGPRDSRDSNDYGPIATGLVIGKITHILWPLHRAGRVNWEEYAERIRKSV